MCQAAPGTLTLGLNLLDLGACVGVAPSLGPWLQDVGIVMEGLGSALQCGGEDPLHLGEGVYEDTAQSCPGPHPVQHPHTLRTVTVAL